MKRLSIFLCLMYSAVSIAQAQSLAVESYTLDNGFTVMLNPDPTANEVSGAVMVNAGGKNDPSDATGIAHYLEHLLFKGTQNMGTTDYEAEKVHLDRIVELYDEAAQTEDPEERTRLYTEINQEALEASKYGLPNEFDKLLRSIGGTGINAFTNNDITFYYNTFPSHELGRWLDLYSHRFENPVFRSFQSELEVVYEEKNRGMDNFQRGLFETLNAELFAGHPYGEQLVLGTVDHLKNPSLTKMYEFFQQNYVANNMALLLSGNFDPEAVKSIIEEKFGDWRSAEVPEFPDYPRRTFSGRETLKVRLTPVNVGLIGYKTVPDTHEDRFALDVVSALLTNSGSTGYLDRLTSEGKLLAAAGFNNALMDDGAMLLLFVPKPIVQSFGKGEKLVMEAVEKIKTGEFSDEDLAAIKSTLYGDFQTGLEDTGDRAVAMGFCYSRGLAWDEYLEYPENIAAITREDVMRVANQYLGEDRLVMISKTGFPKKQKLEKPSFEPVTTDQNGVSEYAEAFEAMEPSLPQPDFVDFQSDVTRAQLDGGNDFYWTENPLNDIFRLQVRVYQGTESDPMLDPMSELLNQAGTSSMSESELKKAFASLGASYFSSVNRNYFSLTVTGIESNLEATMDLLNGIINDATIEQSVVKTVADGNATNRKVEATTPSTMGSVLRSYGIRGEESEYLTRLPLNELKALSADEMAAKAISLFDTYGASVHYVGQRPASEIQALVNEKLQLADNGPRQEPTAGNFVSRSENTILLVHDKKAVQSQVYYTVMSDAFDMKDVAAARAFNHYFGGGFSGLVLQEIREYRSLAYSAGASFSYDSYSDTEPAILGAFTGSQADKTTDAIGVMLGMFDELPQRPERMEGVINYLQQSALTSRPGFRQLSASVESWEAQGYSADPVASAYDDYADLTFQDLLDFHAKYIQGRPYTITIYGDKEQMDLEKIAEWGTLIELTPEDIMVK